MRIRPAEPTTTARLGPSAFRWLTLILPAAFLGTFSFICAGSLWDDAFIYARYGRHLVRYHDFLWNPADPRIEGFSSYIWLALYLPAEALGWPPLALAKGAGIALLVLLAILFARRIADDGAQWPAVATALVLATSFDLAAYASTGLDNVLWAMVAWTYLVWVARAESLTGAHFAVAASGILVRPEGFLLFVPALLRFLDSSPGAVKKRTPPLVGAVVLCTLLLVRWELFGRLLPHAAAAKHFGGSVLSRAVDGIRYLATGFELYAVVPVIVLLVAPAATRSDRLARLCAAFSLASMLFIVVAGGDDTSAFGHSRLFVPLVCPLTYLLFVGLRELAARGDGATRLIGVALVVALLRAPQAFGFLRHTTGATNSSTAAEILGAWRSGFTHVPPDPLSGHLRAATPAGETVALTWAGRVPYETDLPVLDMLGLNDAHIGRAPVRQRGIDVRYDAGYVLDRRPYFICDNLRVLGPLDAVRTLSDRALREMGAWRIGQRELLRDPRLARDYMVDEAAPGSGTCFRRR